LVGKLYTGRHDTLADNKKDLFDNKITLAANRPPIEHGHRAFAEKFQKVQNAMVPKVDPIMRDRLLTHIGIKQAKPKSENLIILSCLGVSGMARQLRSFLWLLDNIGVDYTYLHLPEKEYCCAWGLVRECDGDEKTQAHEFSQYFVGLNIDQARKMGATRMFYFCLWCNTAAQYSFPDNITDIPQRYHLELVVEALKKKPFPLKLDQPKRIAYYEGCHSRHEILVPNCKFDWPAYRKTLDLIKGLEVIDLPVKGCCTVSSVSERLVSQAIEAGASQLVTPCTACWIRIEKAGQSRKFPVKMLSELLLEAAGIRDNGSI
jgi:Fe-S oxidoreductase